MASNLPIREKLTSKMQSAILETGKLARHVQPGWKTNEGITQAVKCTCMQEIHLKNAVDNSQKLKDQIEKMRIQSNDIECNLERLNAITDCLATIPHIADDTSINN
ncbi:hypothetical protein TrispH2_003615 [Trichoplax sp. H2]|nr:hypothetical protein TrispH2_003615 [Trichoplax sp. H2]|eukprot:RDD45488.1 hypothetical protein TrispH2_003615 [Trichoplax sp. H2]